MREDGDPWHNPRMKRDVNQSMIMFSGLFLIVFGVAMIIAQVWQQAQRLALDPLQQQMTASKDGFAATTHYVGLELVMVGAVLQMVGFVGSRFSTDKTSANEHQQLERPFATAKAEQGGGALQKS